MILKSRHDGSQVTAELFVDPATGQRRFRLGDDLVINSPIALLNGYQVVTASSEEIGLLEDGGAWITSDPDPQGP